MYYAFRIIVITALATASFVSVRRAWADWEFRRGTPESVRRAVDLAPLNAEYVLFRALQLDYDGADPTPILERAAVLNPMSSTPRIRLGLAAEIRGDNVSAEKWLLDAARVDHQFEPRWTLANFYFRRENFPEFWKWVRTALEVSYGDRRPAFDLAWRASSQAAEIARAIPDRREAIGAYLSYLLDTHRTDAAAPVALKLAAFHSSADRPLLYGACDEFIRANLADAARDLWRTMFDDPSGIFAGSFEAPRIGHGFDWRTPEPGGVVQLDLDHPSRRRISFDGRQPESCELLRQTLLLKPGRRYTLHWGSRLNGLTSPTGIEWRIGGARAPVDSNEVSFTAPGQLVALTLSYDRPRGEARGEGSLELWGITLK
jgi:tetratricopeptide (TPR) repeat protein